MVRKKFPYKQGVVKTPTHPTLIIGQVVEILEDCGDHYKVRVFINGKTETIQKNEVVVN
jgi:hypothetical protein